MNPAFLHKSYQAEFPLNNDNKYLSQDRTFSDSGSISTGDYSYPPRNAQGGLSNASLSHSLALQPSAGLEYNPQSSIIDHPYHPVSSLLLSSPSSLDDSQATSIQPSSSSFSYASTPKTSSSNASSTDHFPPSINQYTGTLWGDTTMTDFRGTRPPVLHPQVTPALTYGQPGSMASHYLNPSGRNIDQYTSSYNLPRQLSGPDMNHGLFSNKSFNQLPVPMSTAYSPHPSYGAVASPAQGRSEGPPFDDTKVVIPLVTARNHSVKPDVIASISKGFFQVDGKWTCYRRNYFTVSCGFTYKNSSTESQIYVQLPSGPELVRQWAVSISAKTANGSNQESEVRQLVQHTPKRDKATESVPGRHVVQPASPQSLQNNGILPPNAFYSGPQHVPPGSMGNYDMFPSSAHITIPTSYTFERIQFQKATANNGKRRAQQQYFHIVAELSANIGRPGAEDNWVIVAKRESDPMVVRGRSPGHYKDNIRRDGQTHMDPDRGNGPAGDSGQANLPMSYYGGGQASGMDWPPSQRHSQHYAGAFTRRGYRGGSPSQSVSSSTSPTMSPTESEGRTRSAYILERSILNPIGTGANDLATDRPEQSYERKRPFRDHLDGYVHDGEGAVMYMGNTSPVYAYDASHIRGVRPVCVP